MSSRLGCRRAVSQWRGIPPSLPLMRLGLFTPSTRSVVWTTIPSVDLRIGFNSLIGLGFVYLVKVNGLAIFFPGEVCFYESSFSCGLRFPVHPFLMELLDYFGIAPGQLMPNSWRIVVSYMGIWLVAMDGDMLRIDELVYLYRLKASKEYGYYEIVPW